MKARKKAGLGFKATIAPNTTSSLATAAPSTGIWSEGRRGRVHGIGEALGVHVAEADCHEQGTLPSFGFATGTTVHTFLVSYSSRVVVAGLSDLCIWYG